MTKQKLTAAQVNALVAQKLSPEQQELFWEWIRQTREAAPETMELAKVATRIYHELLASPRWGIAEVPVPDGGRPVEGWSVRPQVSFFDQGGSEVTAETFRRIQ